MLGKASALIRGGVLRGKQSPIVAIGQSAEKFWGTRLTPVLRGRPQVLPRSCNAGSLRAVPCFPSWIFTLLNPLARPLPRTPFLGDGSPDRLAAHPIYRECTECTERTEYLHTAPTVPQHPGHDAPTQRFRFRLSRPGPGSVFPQRPRRRSVLILLFPEIRTLFFSWLFFWPCTVYSLFPFSSCPLPC